MQKHFIIFLCFLFIFVNNASALGIGPPVIDINFEPNLVYTNTLYIVNSENYNLPIKMTVENELTEYVILSEYDFILGPKTTPQGTKYINFTISLPEKIGKPGRHRIKILATENLPQAATGIGAIVGVGALINVFVPYPGKYIEFSVSIENPKVNQTIRFLINAINRGNQTIENAKAVLSLYDPEGNVIALFETENKSIGPTIAIEFVKEWLALGIRPGKYTLKTEFFYDGFKNEEETGFMIGSPTAKILSVESKPIIEGTIGKINTKVLSEWNEKILGAYVILDIKNDVFSTRTQSATFDLEPFEEHDVEIFWDTSNSPGPGQYTGLATLYYLNQTYNITFSLEIAPKALEFLPYLLIVIIIILVVLPVFVFVNRKKRARSKYTQKKLM